MSAAGPTEDGEVVVATVDDFDDDLLAAVARLMPQLSSSAPAPTAEQLKELIASQASTLFVARMGPTSSIVGMLTLAVYRIPTGLNAVIEDVVVDEGVRGAGVGGALVLAAVEEARRRGARHVDLTSRASRDAANRLYERVGFERRATNVYRFTPH